MTTEENSHENQSPTSLQPDQLYLRKNNLKSKQIKEKTMVSNSEASQTPSTKPETPTEDPRVAAAISQFEGIKEALSGPKQNDSNKVGKTWVLPKQDPKTDASKP
jgi:hypothetical protein